MVRIKINFKGRTRKIVKFDNKLRKELNGFLCGVDEAGRGPVAGPVVAAAVIFSDDAFIEGVFDSKQVLPQKREELFDEIINSSVCYGIGIVDNIEIDKINILNATKLAMNMAISRLREAPEMIIADGNFFQHETAKVENIIKGDAASFSIAAASILAKVTRDRIMREYQNTYPNFTFAAHKGYCTINHIDEILEYGYTDIHRRSFRLKAMQGELF
jgi:ribonuclease HII